MSASVIIAAAGQGRRMQAKINKQYLLLQGRPVVSYALKACLEAACFSQIIVTVAPGEEDLFRRDVLLPYFPQTNIIVVQGGKERQDSVRNGLEAVAHGIDYVCIHDGARPFAAAELIKKCLGTAKEKGAVVAAVPVKDTIKKVGKNKQVQDTPPREELWAVQTPQVFRRDWLEIAHRKAYQENFFATDDAALLEHYGYPVYVEPSTSLNLKLTTPEDLLLAEALMKGGILDAHRNRL
ncbi:MAG: 2-C-methyl-D-erythritol 4-phosphate cytidylyltransferase [Firmicutes bacterium]|nr:2-C-methyl-D-erythritol 4-phosphate cytidylyltransferase [Bacillota bacterium]